MATYDRLEVTTTRVEFHVPTNEPWGARWVEVEKAFSAATEEMRNAGVLGPDEVPSDDRIRLRGTDESIIISYEREA